MPLRRSRQLRLLCALVVPIFASCGGPAAAPEGALPEAAPEGTSSRRLVGQQCYFGKVGDVEVPLTQIIHELRVRHDRHVVDVAVVFNRGFVDLSYGATAVGWDATRKGQHSFKDLVGSDHTELVLRDANGAVAFQAKIDLLTESGASASGYATLGVEGGDGRVITGDPALVLDLGTSLDDNLNRYGYALVADSPETDASYTPNPEFPSWSFFVEYRLTVDATAFGAAGFGDAFMAMVHASPSKFATNTVEVFERACPDPGDENDPFPSCMSLGPNAECVDPSNPGTSEEGPTDPGESGEDAGGPAGEAPSDGSQMDVGGTSADPGTGIPDL